MEKNLVIYVLVQTQIKKMVKCNLAAEEAKVMMEQDWGCYPLHDDACDLRLEVMQENQTLHLEEETSEMKEEEQNC